jgi:hypothetical protein
MSLMGKSLKHQRRRGTGAPNAGGNHRRRKRQGDKLMKKTQLLAVAVVALIPIAGFAGEGDKSKPKTAEHSGTFDTLDANKDGRISMPEASADPVLVESFSKADKDGDGYLDNSEYMGSTAKPR